MFVMELPDAEGRGEERERDTREGEGCGAGRITKKRKPAAVIRRGLVAHGRYCG